MKSSTDDSNRGNFVSEWFGYRTYPAVRGGSDALRIQQARRCPFLTAATHEDRTCVKVASSSGICAINNASNGFRQDWLVCPYRALDPGLIRNVVGHLFNAESSESILIAPAPTLAQRDTKSQFIEQIRSGGLAVAYLQDKLGGEISVSATDRSPEFSFDITLAELVSANGGTVDIGRFGVMEIQTMDFHGSYRHAVANLNDSLRLHEARFAEVLQENQRWLSDRIEGPNIANVFKRTFYQMMLKFQAGVHPRSVGAALAIPQAVWDSWQRHLGRPNLTRGDDGTHALRRPGTSDSAPHAWICVFDTDADSAVHPNPVVIRQVIATDAASVAYYTLHEVPSWAFSNAGAVATIIAAIRRRLSAWWPEMSSEPSEP